MQFLYTIPYKQFIKKIVHGNIHFGTTVNCEDKYGKIEFKLKFW